MSQVTSMDMPLGRGKRIALGILGAILILLLASPPEFAAFMVVTAWSSDLDGGAHKFHIFMRGVGTLVSIGAALVLIVKPSWALGSAQKFIATGVGFIIAGIISTYIWPPVIVYPIVALIVVGVVLWAFRGRLPWQQPGAMPSMSRPLLAITAVVAVPLIVFALNEASLQRGPELVHGDLGHWGSGAANAFGIIILMLFAARRMPGWRVPAWGAGFTLFMFGLASILMPNQASSVGEGWGTLAIIASVAFVGVAELEGRLFTRPAAQPAGSQGD